MSIETLAYELRLPYTRHHYKQFIEEAKHKGFEIEEAIEALLQNEIELRASAGITRRIQRAKFTNKKISLTLNISPIKVK